MAGGGGGGGGLTCWAGSGCWGYGFIVQCSVQIACGLILNGRQHAAVVASHTCLSILTSRYPPFFDEHPFRIYEKILEGKIVWPKNMDLNAKDLIKKLLTRDVTSRLGSLRVRAARRCAQHSSPPLPLPLPLPARSGRCEAAQVVQGGGLGRGPAEEAGGEYCRPYLSIHVHWTLPACHRLCVVETYGVATWEASENVSTSCSSDCEASVVSAVPPTPCARG